MKEFFTNTRFTDASLTLIAKCNSIIDDYKRKGYRLTVRQLYYQLVARDIVENTIKSYNNVVSLLTNARLAGRTDWEAIEDRTRSFTHVTSFDSPSHGLRSLASWYHENRWQDQECRVFAIVEKEALAGVLEPICSQYDVPLLAARGYPSVSTLYEFAQVLKNFSAEGNEIHLLHMGDHDPSGIDMTRDLEDRLRLLTHNEVVFSLERLALNIDQVHKYNPPPNPAKSTDSRFASYAAQFGRESWELDALSPENIHALISTAVKQYIDDDAWAESEARIEANREKIEDAAKQMEDKEHD